MCSYSKNFTTMKVQAHAMVIRMFNTSSLRCASCALRTAQAAVRLLIKQHAGVDGTHRGVQEVVRVHEHFRMHAAVHGVRAEQAREEQHLGQQEQPDAELPGVELLLVRVEVMGQVRATVPMCVVRAMRVMAAVRGRSRAVPAFLGADVADSEVLSLMVSSDVRSSEGECCAIRSMTTIYAGCSRRSLRRTSGSRSRRTGRRRRPGPCGSCSKAAAKSTATRASRRPRGWPAPSCRSSGSSNR